MIDDTDHEVKRKRMVANQLAGRGFTNPHLLAAFESVPRHLFVPEASRPHAYADSALRIGSGQTISQPYIVALMTDLLELNGDERLLEVGTGSGYQAAILGQLAGEVHTVEILSELAKRAESLLRELGYANVHVHVGDGSLGWPVAAPYAGILMAAAAPKVPQLLLAQLMDGGRLILPVAEDHRQLLEVWRRHGAEYTRRIVTEVAFVPLRGKSGWRGS